MNFIKSNTFQKWSLIFLGSLTWFWTMFKTGMLYSFGMGFWGANGHDGVWHIALSESLSRGSLTMPVFSGLPIQNYHIGFDALMALLHRVTLIPIPNLYFQVIPLFISIVLGALVYDFVFDWTLSKKSALLSTFFVYFGGGFGFLIGKGESSFWSTQSISTLINPPFAVSLIFLLLGLMFLNKKRTVINFIICTILFGSLIELKAYAGVLALVSLFVSGIYQFIFEKKKDVLTIFLSSLLVSIVLMSQTITSPGSLFVWQPMWFLETMMGLSDRLGWQRFYSAMTTYKSGGNLIKLIPAYIVAFGVFLIGNIGTRLIGVVAFSKLLNNFKKLRWVDVFIFTMILSGIAIPMFFLQSGTPWNTIQFFYYSLFFLGLLAGISLDSFIKNYSLGALTIRIIEVGVILLTVPTTLITLKDVYLPQRPPAMVSNYELSALNFLADKPAGVVLTYPFDEYKSKEAEPNPPRPLYLYTSTAYVAAFSKHETYLEDEINLDITGYDWKNRKKEVEKWYKESNAQLAREFLKSNNIKYVYWLKGQRALLGEAQLGLVQIFENSQVFIYQVVQ